jgi:hypothetical protein
MKLKQILERNERYQAKSERLMVQDMKNKRMYDHKNYKIVDKLTRNDQRLRSLEETESHLI